MAKKERTEISWAKGWFGKEPRCMFVVREDGIQVEAGVSPDLPDPNASPCFLADLVNDTPACKKYDEAAEWKSGNPIPLKATNLKDALAEVDKRWKRA